MSYVDEQVSGNIWRSTDKYKDDGWSYRIQMNKSQSWGLPVGYITPEDLRILADQLEELRNERTG